ncbi:MAG: hypothetical protein ACLP7W_01785 [Solirubrobacteraceae bacterium]|jgi:hypothetical protein
MGKRSRRNRPGRRLPAGAGASSPPPREDHRQTPGAPERLLLDQIAAGALDQHLMPIADAIHARLQLLETVNSTKALAMLSVGDRVRFNHRTKPQYLRGVHGVVIEIEHDTATVCVHEPIGRFSSGQIRQCPPLLLERLHPAA